MFMAQHGAAPGRPQDTPRWRRWVVHFAYPRRWITHANLVPLALAGPIQSSRDSDHGRSKHAAGDKGRRRRPATGDAHRVRGLSILPRW